MLIINTILSIEWVSIRLYLGCSCSCNSDQTLLGDFFVCLELDHVQSILVRSLYRRSSLLPPLRVLAFIVSILSIVRDFRSFNRQVANSLAALLIFFI